MRGRHHDQHGAGDRRGATLAGAGTTRCISSSGPGTWSYPRGRGDDLYYAGKNASKGELPPRVWGRRTRHLPKFGVVRATPACAGTTWRPSTLPPLPASYPRGCGDDKIFLATLTWLSELPPRVRGRLRLDRRESPGRRATPACAGTTQEEPAQCGDSQSYPRVCGDDRHEARYWPVMTELPPRVRGRLGRVGAADHPRGATPACAGTTLWSFSHGAMGRSYPRVCGDDPQQDTTEHDDLELPPRVRGRPTAGHDGT
ncbi:hypothetical protein HNR57_007584 [Streptomyces paradoxus]|uniref:Uncharacterized protein n=1 Tax=Streptomyces paradoxus TaxID=66375 RepID=A0A7W9WLN2_9ACTN|nr:hypothetical protein [Streptomyces paradoxus]